MVSGGRLWRTMLKMSVFTQQTKDFSLDCHSGLGNHEDCGLFPLPHNSTYPLCLQFKKLGSCQLYMSVFNP